MEKRNLTLENSLLKLTDSNNQLKNYFNGWDESLKNFNDVFREELKLKKIAEEQMNCVLK